MADADYPFTDDDIERYAATLLGLPPVDASDGGDDDEDEEVVDLPDDDGGDGGADEPDSDATTDDEEEGDSAPSTDLPSSSVDVAAVLAPETLLAYAQFDAVLKGRPDAREFFQRMLEGGEVPTPAPTPPPASSLPTLPELDDDALADPAIRALYDANRATLDALAAERARVDQLTNATTIRAQQEFTARALEAKSSFGTQYNLDPGKVESIAKHADELGVSQSLLANTTDVSTAVRKALELAMWDMPEYRTDAIDSAVKERNAKHRKRQKLAGVGGGSGSTPREAPARPMSDADRRAAMIADVADQWFGQPQPTE